MHPMYFTKRIRKDVNFRELGTNAIFKYTYKYCKTKGGPGPS